ncbi:MAG: UPF0182 family protein, partial [Solirubrobacterales bacterium]|nr:UPF0182 family protein [Solirubrobacterales bacterium]
MISTPLRRDHLPAEGDAAVAVVLFLVFTRIYTNVLWYQSIGFGSIYGTLITSRIGLFAAGTVLMGGVVLLNLAIAKRLRPKIVPNTPDQQMLARYRSAFEPHMG